MKRGYCGEGPAPDGSNAARFTLCASFDDTILVKVERDCGEHGPGCPAGYRESIFRVTHMEALQLAHALLGHVTTCRD